MDPHPHRAESRRESIIYIFCLLYVGNFFALTGFAIFSRQAPFSQSLQPFLAFQGAWAAAFALMFTLYTSPSGVIHEEPTEEHDNDVRRANLGCVLSIVSSLWVLSFAFFNGYRTSVYSCLSMYSLLD